MTLFEQLKDIIPLGYNVTFSHEAFNLSIRLGKDNDKKNIYRTSWLPLSDHFYEKKVVDCIEFMINEIRKEITNSEP